MDSIKDCQWCKGRYRCQKHAKPNRFKKEEMARIMEKILDQMIVDSHNKFAYFKNKNGDFYSLHRNIHQFRWL